MAQIQKDYSITSETFPEILEAIRDKMGDEKVYLFLDGAGHHKGEMKAEMAKLNIEPVYNVCYRFEWNPLERLWGLYKQAYRYHLLDRMLEGPGYKDTPLKDCLLLTF